MDLEYTPEQKNRLEIEKLSAEVADLRSWVRRWLGSLGGLLGIVTALVSVIVATHQMSRSAQEADAKILQAETHLAQAEKMEAERLQREISAQTDVKSRELKDIEAQLAVIKNRLAEAQQDARSLVSSIPPKDFSSKALEMVIKFQGISQPSKWEGGASGVTLGILYDLGFATSEQFEQDWKNYLTATQIDRLKGVIGLSGDKAGQRSAEFTDINISPEAALAVFTKRTLPIYQARTAAAFPGLEKLPLDAQGELVSLVIERGTSMQGDRAREMRAIRDAVASGNLQEIANQLRAMKRLWVGKGFDGLLRLRDAEAALVESAIPR